jgi:hypothetical protein
MNKDLIEKLKKNKVAFGLMTEEEQECFRKAGRKNTKVYTIHEQWVDDSLSLFYVHEIYRIKPSYTPEPEYIDLEIKIFRSETVDTSWLGCWINDSFITISDLPSLPNFVNFFSDFSKLVDDVEISMQSIAMAISEGKKVYARFRK